MRLATVRRGGTTTAVRIEGGTAVVLDAVDTRAVLAAPDLARGGGEEIDAADLDFAPLVLNPARVVCAGLNYKAHLEELGVKTPKYPTLFSEFASSLIGARDDLVVPSITEQLDWEVELTLVIGTWVFRAGLTEAEAAIGGYTVGNDVTMRDWQLRTPQWLAGKAADGTTPVGPVLVTPDEVDGARSLEVRCEVDGEVVQIANTSDMLFGAAALVAYTSQFTALEPGDLLMTGTPAGVGHVSGRHLQVGEVMRTSIEGLGECVNLAVAEKA